MTVSGCSWAKSGQSGNQIPEEKGDETMLTDRQIQILTEKGLPASYEDLTPLQRHSIIAVEEMLRYLEEKYGKEFRYVDYFKTDEEKLIADCDDATVTVWRGYSDGAFFYDDNYRELLATPLYRQALSEFVLSACGEGNCLVVSELTDLDDGVSAEKDTIVAHACARSSVFVSGAVDETAFQTLVDDYVKWISASAGGHTSRTVFYLTKAEDFAKINAANYVSMTQELSFRAVVHCSLSASGQMNRY